MARVRDTLRLIGRPCGRSSDAPVTTPATFDDSETAPIQGEIEIPYIEVGASVGALEASPSVLAATPEPLARSRSLPARRIQTAESLTPERMPGSVNLHPLPLERAALRPVAERLASQLIAFHRPDDPLSEQYRKLAADLTSQLPAGEHQVLLFASAVAAAPTSTLLLNVGIARVGQRRASIVVVDANLRQPALAALLGLPQLPGLCDVLAGGLSLQRAIQETGIDDLHVLTAGKVHEPVTGLLAGEAMQAILRHLRARYDWVLVAAPHWDGRPDLVALGAGCDAAYLVVSEAEAQSAQVQELIQVLPQQGINLRGCVYS